MAPLRSLRSALVISFALIAVLPWVARAAAPASSARSVASSGQLIALSGEFGGKAVKGFALATINLQGKNAVLIAPATGGLRVSDFVFTWSPSGRSIAYPCSKGPNDQRSAVCAVDVATGRNYPITHSPSVSIEPYAWGPGGQIVSDCNDRDLCLVNAATGRVTFITRAGSSVRNGYVFGDDVVWSPDGTTVGFTCRRNFQQDRRFCYLKDGKLTVQSRSWNGVRFEGWTPDSKRIVWWGRFSGGQPLVYHEQKVDGSGLEPLPENAIVRGPHYSADGRKRLALNGAKPGLKEEPLGSGPSRWVLTPQRGITVWDYAFQPPRGSS